ncbi:MAG: tetratricopeptide repeat protein, partial [Thermoplasmata archaeon]|nr:tetratricopeptide repeat protein [Thermoplasmata archaeon]
MESSCFTGRKAEIESLNSLLGGCIAGKGKTALILGEPGIGKSTLVAEFLKNAGKMDITVLRGTAEEGIVQPFGVFSAALAPIIGDSLFQNEEYTSFFSIFLISNSGMLMAKSSSDEESMDADIFAGMLSAVQNFVRDSFDVGGQDSAGLGKLVYGDMTIFIEHGRDIFLTAVIKGREHEGMRKSLADAARTLDSEYGTVLSAWNGSMRDLALVQDFIDVLAKSRYLVKRDLEGVKFENERMRVAEQVANKVAVISKDKSVMLLIEDLHWADESSMFLFAYLARNIGSERVLLVATARPSELSAFERHRFGLNEDGMLEEMELGGLDESGTRHLINGLFSPNEFPENFIKKLIDDSKGNPLFIRETLNQLAADNNILMDHDAYILSREDYEFPKSIEDAVLRRLENLEPEVLTVAEYCSCIGINFTHGEMESLPNIDSAKGAIEKLAQAGIVHHNENRGRFSHAMFQHTLYQSISDRWKAIYHRSLGEYYERMCGSDTESAIYDLARHFMHSNEHTKAWGYCVRAGDKAEQSYDANLAMTFYKSALALMPAPGKHGCGSDDEFRILEKLGDSQRRLGLIPESLDNYSRAMERLQGNETVYLGLLLKMHTCHMNVNQPEKGLAILDLGAQLVDKAAPETAAEYLATVAHMQSLKGEEEMSRCNLEAAQKKLAVVENSEIRVNVLTIMGRTFEKIGPDEKALEMFEIAVLEAEKSDSLKSRARAYSNIGIYMHFRGEHAAASKLFEKSTSYWERLGDVVELQHDLVSLGMAYSDCGELEKSLACLKRALNYNRKLGAKVGMASILGNIGYTLAVMGRHEESLRYQEEALDIRRKFNSVAGMAWSYYDMSLVHNQAGNYAKAGDCLNSALELFVQSGDTIGIAYSKYALASILKNNGREDEAAALYFEVLEIAREKQMLQEQFSCRTNLVLLGRLEYGDVIGDLTELNEKINSPETRIMFLDFKGTMAL